MSINEKLKQARLSADLTQEVLAEKIGVSRQTVSNWENGRSYPDIAGVIILSEIYNMTLDSLLKGDNEMIKHFKESTDIVKNIKRVIILIIVFALICTLLFLRSITTGNAYEANFQDINENWLQPGRYYMNGDTDSLFYEIFDDGTMQLKGGELPDCILFKAGNRECDFERFNFFAARYSVTRKGYFNRVDYPRDLHIPPPRWYIYRDVTTIDELEAEPQIIFAEIVNGGDMFIFWNYVFIRM